MQLAFEQVTIEFQSEVTTVVQAIEGVVATCVTGDGLRTDVDEFELYGRQGILHRERVFELAQTNGEFIAFGDTIIGVELLYHAVEVVHEEEEPAVGDAGLCPQQGALQVVTAFRRSAAHGLFLICVGVACLSITIERDAALQLLKPVNLFSGFLLLRHHTRADECQQQCEGRLSEKIFESHCFFLFFEMKHYLIGLFSANTCMRSSSCSYWWSSIKEVHTRKPS